MKQHFIVVLLTAITLVLAVFAIFPYTDPVTYHRQEMRKGWDEYFEDPPVLGEDFFFTEERLEPMERYKFHREELVRLGAFIKKEHVFQHLQVRSPQAKHFLDLITYKKCPPRENIESPYLEPPKPFRCTFWFESDQLEKWDQFIREHDVPDYNEKFMHIDPSEGWEAK